MSGCWPGGTDLTCTTGTLAPVTFCAPRGYQAVGDRKCDNSPHNVSVVVMVQQVTMVGGLGKQVWLPELREEGTMVTLPTFILVWEDDLTHSCCSR